MTQDERLKAIEDDIESGGITSENLVWLLSLVKMQREVLEDALETMEYVIQYFDNTGLSALNDCQLSIAKTRKTLEWEG